MISSSYFCSVYERGKENAFDPLSTNPTKWSNTLKQLTNCLSVFDHFVRLALRELRFTYKFNATDFIGYGFWVIVKIST